MFGGTRNQKKACRRCGRVQQTQLDYDTQIKKRPPILEGADEIVEIRFTSLMGGICTRT